MISAQQYYVEYGPELVIDRLQSLLSAYIPDSFLQGQKAITFWIQVSHTHHRIILVKWHLYAPSLFNNLIT